MCTVVRSSRVRKLLMLAALISPVVASAGIAAAATPGAKLAEELQRSGNGDDGAWSVSRAQMGRRCLQPDTATAGRRRVSTSLPSKILPPGTNSR